MEIEELLQRYRELSDQYAPAKAQRAYLEEYKKSVIALLMKTAERIKNITTSSGQEREALASDQYVKLLSDLKDAVLTEEKIRYHMKAVEWEIEIWRTKQANERAERRAYGA